MICTSCGATIADKAIVCYRCGAPTAIPASEKPNRPDSRRPPASPVAALVLLVIGVALGGFALFPEGSVSWMPLSREMATAAGVASATLGAWLALRRRR
jgi:hypothetical protein